MSLPGALPPAHAQLATLMAPDQASRSTMLYHCIPAGAWRRSRHPACLPGRPQAEPCRLCASIPSCQALCLLACKVFCSSGHSDIYSRKDYAEGHRCLQHIDWGRRMQHSQCPAKHAALQRAELWPVPASVRELGPWCAQLSCCRWRPGRSSAAVARLPGRLCEGMSGPT